MTTTSVTSGATRLLAYVPRLPLRWTPTRDHPRHMRVDGMLAFVDISGSTALTERLARKGRAPTTPCVPRARHTACGQRPLGLDQLGGGDPAQVDGPAPARSGSAPRPPLCLPRHRTPRPTEGGGRDAGSTRPGRAGTHLADLTVDDVQHHALAGDEDR